MHPVAINVWKLFLRRNQLHSESCSYYPKKISRINTIVIIDLTGHKHVTRALRPIVLCSSCFESHGSFVIPLALLPSITFTLFKTHHWIVASVLQTSTRSDSSSGISAVFSGIFMRSKITSNIWWRVARATFWIAKFLPVRYILQQVSSAFKIVSPCISTCWLVTTVNRA